MQDPRDTSKKAWTVGEMVAALSQWPPHYRLDFNPNDCDDMTTAASVEVLEGDTSDGPGSVWIKLEDE